MAGPSDIETFLWSNGFNSGRFQLHMSRNVGPSDTKTFLWPNGFNSGCFQLYMSQNVATLMLSLTSQSCSDSLPSVCLARQVRAIYRPPEHQWTPDRPVNEASVKVDRRSFGNGISMNC